MPRVIRAVESDLSQGHCWPAMMPRRKIGTVTAHAENIMTVGDAYKLHPGCCGDCRSNPPHAGAAIAGSPNVFVEGKPVHRDTDFISCGDVGDGYFGVQVFANGGGAPGPGSRPPGQFATGPGSNNIPKFDPGERTGYVALLPEFTYSEKLMNENVVDIKLPYVVEFDRQLGQGSNYIYVWQTIKSKCDVGKIIPSEIYTPLEEENIGKLFKNYPGSPLSPYEGAVLPEYAPDRPRAQIPMNKDFKSNLNTGFSIGNLPSRSLNVTDMGVITGSHAVAGKIVLGEASNAIAVSHRPARGANINDHIKSVNSRFKLNIPLSPSMVIGETTISITNFVGTTTKTIRWVTDAYYLECPR